MSERQPSEQLLQIRQSVESNMRTQPLADGVTMEETDSGGVPVVVLTPPDGYSATLLYMHGGGYRLGSARGFAAYTSHLAAACKVRVVSVDYRLSPEHPFPAALTDCRNAYVGLLGSGAEPHQVVVGGDSAGGGLAAALLIELKMQGIPSPAAAVLLSPWADLRVVNESYTQNAETDQLFSRASATDGAAAVPERPPGRRPAGIHGPRVVDRSATAADPGQRAGGVA